MKIRMKKPIEELDEELCEYCPCTDYGSAKVNTGSWNLCEGCRCEEAYQNYLEDEENEEE